MTPQELFALAEKVASGIASETEIAIYYTALQQQQVNVEWQEESMGNKIATGAVIRQRIWDKMEQPRLRSLPWRYAAAAAVVLALAGSWLWITRFHKKQTPAVAETKIQLSPDIHPGGDKAILLLANGTSIVLDSAANGALAQEAGTTITKEQNGQLAYSNNATNPSPAKVLLYNTLSTPRGGQYNITLPDGSRVWLNAASSIHYPVAFTGADRQVEITGEAFFEVTPIAGKPFKVISDNQQIQVLGTSFNINAYPDEQSTNTTLLTGSIRITNQRSGISQSANLIPGQQAIVADASLKVVDAQVSAVVAWKHGLFEFNNADVQSIMRQVSRWYDVEVTYKGAITSRRFTGKIQRNAQLSEVLEMLSYAGIRFTAKDKTIEVID